jgi:hypothetical protein
MLCQCSFAKNRVVTYNAWMRRAAVVPLALPRVITLSVTDDTLSVELEDGRTVSVPIGWYPRLAHGTPATIFSNIAARTLPILTVTKTATQRAAQRLVLWRPNLSFLDCS